MNIQAPHSADATTVEEGLARVEAQAAAEFTSDDATALAMQNTLMTPRFYTTDFDALDAIDVSLVREEWDQLISDMLDDPNKKRGHYGGVVAAPTVRDVMDFSLSYLGVPTDVEDAPIGPLVLDPPGLEPLVDPEALADTSAPSPVIGMGE